jgi:hypothetical protein
MQNWLTRLLQLVVCFSMVLGVEAAGGGPTASAGAYVATTAIAAAAVRDAFRSNDADEEQETSDASDS